MPKPRRPDMFLGAALIPRDSVNTDPCCGACRSSLGVCLSKHRCQHHIDAQKQDDADHRARQTYRNPTADRAIARADRQKRRQERN